MAFSRTMTGSMLTPIRHVYDANRLITGVKCDPTEEAFFLYQAIPSGRCGHLDPNTGTGEKPLFKLGCTGNEKVPCFIFRDSDEPSTGFESSPIPADNGVNWAQGSEGQRVLVYVGFEGMEMATTEFDSGRAYVVGEYLRAPEMGSTYKAATPNQDWARDSAGKLTNDTVVNGADTIVGIVAPGVVRDDNPQVDEYKNTVLAFYTTYRPPVAGLITGTPTNITARG